MKFSKKFTNKLVSYTDRYFTYDHRKLKREGDFTHDFEFIAHNRDTQTDVYISRTKYGMYLSIKKDNYTVYQGIAKTYKDISNFKKMIRCLG